MESPDRRLRRANRLAAAALVVSVVSLAGSVVIFRDSQVNAVSTEEVSQRVYDRLLGEVAAELEPVYRDFELESPLHPKSFRELLNPMIGVWDAESSP
jgi:hypothetical protein